MKRLGIYKSINNEIGQLIVADIADETVKSYLEQNDSILKLIKKEAPVTV